MSPFSIICVGLSHRQSSTEVREKFFLSKLEKELFLSELKAKPYVKEVMILSTCNRTEIYAHLMEASQKKRLLEDLFKLKKLAFDSEVASHFFLLDGPAAIEHLLRVVTSLDSMVIGEKEIMGQVKDMVELARSKETLQKTFHLLCNIAVRTGKKSRNETEIGVGGSSVSWAAVEFAEKKLGSLVGKSVLILGSGKMADLSAKQLRRKKMDSLFVMNRTEKHAEELAEKFQGQVVPFCDIKETLLKVDLVLCSVGAPHYVLEKGTVEKVLSQRKSRPLLLLDISIPRNIDPLINELSQVVLAGMDDLKGIVEENMFKRHDAIKEVETLIESKMEEFFKKHKKLFSQNLISLKPDQTA